MFHLSDSFQIVLHLFPHLLSCLLDDLISVITMFFQDLHSFSNHDFLLQERQL